MHIALFTASASLTLCLTACAAQLGPKSANTPRGASLQWEISFGDELTTEEYARQLDYFRIEIGAVAKNGRIEYVSQVSSRKPVKHVGSVQTEYRRAISWKKGNLHTADRRLLSRSGISADKKELLHYLPTEVEARLIELQKDYANRDAREIRRTRYAIRPKGEGYEFVVVEQDPPRPTDPRPPSAARKSEASERAPD